jgi:hypothetical protein
MDCNKALEIYEQCGGIIECNFKENTSHVKSINFVCDLKGCEFNLKELIDKTSEELIDKTPEELIDKTPEEKNQDIYFQDQFVITNRKKDKPNVLYEIGGYSIIKNPVQLFYCGF